MKHLNIIIAFIAINLLTINAQNSALIDPVNYKTTSSAFVIPDLPSGSDFNLIIKGGEVVFITFSGIDENSGSFYKNKAPSRTEVGTFLMTKYGDASGWLVNYRKNGEQKTIILDINFQADIYDRTIGSATYGMRPDFIWINAGESATVSGGQGINPDGLDIGSGYIWRNIDKSLISMDYTDSVKVFKDGVYILNTIDGSGLHISSTHDTISILEKPTLNNIAKTLNFTSITEGITYKLLKVSSINGTDTTWIETENFVGDGNSKNITLTDGKYKLTTTLGIHTSVYPYGYFVVGITTALGKTKEENITYRLVDNHLQFDNEVNLKFYSIQGQLLQQENGSSFKLVRQTGIFTATDKNGNTITAKILLK